MAYLVSFLVLLIAINVISSFLDFSKIKSYYFSFFLKQVVVLTCIISAFAIFETRGKTIMIVVLPILFYLILSAELRFCLPSFSSIKKNGIQLIFVIPLLIFQYYLNIDFTSFQFYLPSDDILFYGNVAKNIADFGSENTAGVLNGIYPDLFDGAAPYHYFELWFLRFCADIVS